MANAAIFFGYCLFLSLAAFLLYAADKARAKKSAWRIRESVLLSVGFLGGAVGALLAMHICRHKTKHIYFYLVNILGVLWQACLLFYLLISAV